MRNRTSDLRIFTLRCSTTEPQILYGERGLLRSSYDTRPTKISNVDSVIFVYRMKEMVSLELGKAVEHRSTEIRRSEV